MPEETDPPQPPPEQPTLLGGVPPDEMFARGMDSEYMRMTSVTAGTWQPPTLEEAARLFPGYEVLQLLGRGGMGAVYQARQIELDRLVAIKLLPLEISVDKDFVDRFRREARAMAKLDHPNIIPVYDFGTTREGHLFFVMAFVEGANLADIIHQAGLDGQQALSIVEQICTALAYAHGKGIVHRDIKPANVMIDAESRVKVADFGLARLIDPSTEQMGHTMTGTVMGTPDYMAPEQTRGMNVDHRADIYSLGVMIYEMLCREVPKGIFQPPSQRMGCDPRIDHIVIKAMQQVPDHRYQSTQEMKADVATARTLLPAPPPSPAPGMGEPLPPKPVVMKAVPPGEAKKIGFPLYGGIAALVLTLAALGYFAPWKKGDSRGGRSAVPETNVAAGGASLVSATKDAPFVNTLGMKFVPVPIIGGPTGGQRVLFSVWDTRVQDYAAFVEETKHGWSEADFLQGPTHPAVNVTWEDTQFFCQWLTAREQAAGSLAAGFSYRLPSDHEWSCAVGLAGEDAAKLPVEKSQKINDAFPWGPQWPPPQGAGNYAGEELRPALKAGQYIFVKDVIAGYNDGFVNTSPVGSFAANRFGLYDMGGNVWQWCEDWMNKGQNERVLRGAAWRNFEHSTLLSSGRAHFQPGDHNSYLGFRCVLGPARQ